MRTEVAPRHLAHGFIDELLDAKRYRRPYDRERAMAKAMCYANAEMGQQYARGKRDADPQI